MTNKEADKLRGVLMEVEEIQEIMEQNIGTSTILQWLHWTTPLISNHISKSPRKRPKIGGYWRWKQATSCTRILLCKVFFVTDILFGRKMPMNFLWNRTNSNVKNVGSITFVVLLPVVFAAMVAVDPAHEIDLHFHFFLNIYLWSCSDDTIF